MTYQKEERYTEFPEVAVKLVLPEQRLSPYPIVDVQTAVTFLNSILAESPADEAIAIMLDRERRPLCYIRVGTGFSKDLCFSVHQLLRCALLSGAKGVILLHHKASVGIPSPEAADLKTVEELSEALRLLYLELYDYILTNQKQCSFSCRERLCGPWAKSSGRTPDLSDAVRSLHPQASREKKGEHHAIPRIQLQVSVTGAEVIE